MPVLTVNIPPLLHRRLEEEKRRTGLSKSDIARQIMLQFYHDKRLAAKQRIVMGEAACSR